MSDESVVGVSLEDDTTPTPVPGSQTAAPPVPPAEPPAEVDPNSVDLKDEQQVRGLLAELSRVRGTNRDLKAKAERADQLEQYVQQKQPYITVLEQNPDLFKRPSAPPAEPPKPGADPDALEAAQLMDFYKPDGSPDTDRGAKWLALQDKRAGKLTQQAVQPFAEVDAQRRAT